MPQWPSALPVGAGEQYGTGKGGGERDGGQSVMGEGCSVMYYTIQASSGVPSILFSMTMLRERMDRYWIVNAGTDFGWCLLSTYFCFINVNEHGRFLAKSIFVDNSKFCPLPSTFFFFALDFYASSGLVQRLSPLSCYMSACVSVFQERRAACVQMLLQWRGPQPEGQAQSEKLDVDAVDKVRAVPPAQLGGERGDGREGCGICWTLL